MEERKFKVGQTITAVEMYQGFQDIEIYDIDEKYYHCRILNGTVTIPIQAVEKNYKLKDSKRHGK